MAEWKEETFNYEILLRFGDSGLNKGRLTGASRTTITQTTKDGVPIAGGTNINPPEQLALIAGQEGEMLSTVLGEVNAQTIVQNQVLTAALTAEQSRTAALDSELAAVHGQADALTDDLAAANNEVARLMALLPVSPLTADVDAADQLDSV